MPNATSFIYHIIFLLYGVAAAVEMWYVGGGKASVSVYACVCVSI